MFDITGMIQSVSSHILYQNLIQPQLSDVTEIIPLTAQTVLQAGCIYTGTWKLAQTLMTARAPALTAPGDTMEPAPLTFFLSGTEVPAESQLRPFRQHNLIVTSLPPDRLYLCLHDVFQAEQNWLRELTDAITQKKSLRDILQFAEEIRSTLDQSAYDSLERSRSCSVLMQAIIEETLTDANEIYQSLSRLTHPPKAFCACIVIRFQESVLLHSDHILSRLEAIFPADNHAVYGDSLIILHSQEERTFDRYDFDYEQLEQLLARHNGYAGISSATRRYEHLRTMFLIASDILTLGQALTDSPAERIFSAKDYNLYYIINLCAESFISQHHHNDLVYLMHPSIIHLCRYDRKHNNNLHDVLFYYLITGRSLNKTAKLLYMHRNTVLNKLNRIEELTDSVLLEDGYLQTNLIFSSYIVRYYSRYLGEELKL